jgi:hypothetical protein
VALELHQAAWIPHRCPECYQDDDLANHLAQYG